MWNLLDFAACAFPVTFAEKAIDEARDMSQFESRSELDGQIQADYDPEFYHRAPVSLQLVGKRLEQEKMRETGG